MSVSGASVFDTLYSVRLDEVDSTTTYLGEATIGADTASSVWRIRKLVTVSTVLSILWADGDKEFNNVWDNRASLTYQ